MPGRIPSILVTGQGFPPLAVRACVHRLVEAFDLPVLGLVDCNPFGENWFLRTARKTRFRAYMNDSDTMGRTMIDCRCAMVLCSAWYYVA